MGYCSTKVEQTTDVVNNMHKSWIHYAEWMKPDSKDYNLIWINYFMYSVRDQILYFFSKQLP